MKSPQGGSWSRHLVFCVVAFCLIITVRASNDCAPSTWLPGQFQKRAATSTSSSSFAGATSTANATVPVTISPLIASGDVAAGEVNCRYTGSTEDMDINYYTCTALAVRYGITIELFFLLNPELHPDCGNIQADTDYCVQGFIEPVRATAGLCGPPHANATCLGTEFQCCNANTFTCGNSTEDCADGTCYEGACAGDSVFTTNGQCGRQHGYRQCAGVWGDCCNADGQCGTGQSFCGYGVCQLGNCTLPNVSLPTGTSSGSSSTGSATTTATGTSTSSTSTSVPTPNSDCTQGTGDGGYLGLCSFSCSYGFCPSPCTCTAHGIPGTPPPLTGDRGYALPGLPADFGPLCDFTTAHGYFPDGVCTKTPPSSTPSNDTVCVQGAGTGGYTGLCDFCCHYGYCPPGPCTCTSYGAQIAPPPETGTSGVPAPGLDSSYSGLCSFACNHGYCPPGSCSPS